MRSPRSQSCAAFSKDADSCVPLEAAIPIIVKAVALHFAMMTVLLALYARLLCTTAISCRFLLLRILMRKWP